MAEFPVSAVGKEDVSTKGVALCALCSLHAKQNRGENRKLSLCLLSSGLASFSNAMAQLPKKRCSMLCVCVCFSIAPLALFCCCGVISLLEGMGATFCWLVL